MQVRGVNDRELALDCLWAGPVGCSRWSRRNGLRAAEERIPVRERTVCIDIDSRCVILNVLQAREQVTLPQLAAFAAAFKQRVHNAYVDISDASVFSVIEEYPEVVGLTGNLITREPGFEAFRTRRFVDDTVNRHLPANIRRHLQECAEATA